MPPKKPDMLAERSAATRVRVIKAGDKGAPEGVNTPTATFHESRRRGRRSTHGSVWPSAVDLFRVFCFVSYRGLVFPKLFFFRSRCRFVIQQNWRRRHARLYLSANAPLECGIRPQVCIQRAAMCCRERRSHGSPKAGFHGLGLTTAHDSSLIPDGPVSLTISFPRKRHFVRLGRNELGTKKTRLCSLSPRQQL